MADILAGQVKDLNIKVERLIADVGNGVKVSNDNITIPPTDAELDTAFGDAANLFDGFIGIVDDNTAGTNVYLCIQKNSAWWYVALTKAV